MIRDLVNSAFQTGYMSVESEGLIHQVILTKSYRQEDLQALAKLYGAMRAGTIKQEGTSSQLLQFLEKSCDRDLFSCFDN